jgi:phage terminase large subunit GpA-like protein
MSSIYAGFLEPPPPMSVTEFAEKHRVLTGRASSMPGPYSTRDMPYVPMIMNCMNDPEVASIAFVAASQISKTTLLENGIFYFSCYKAIPMIFASANEILLTNFVNERLRPSIQESEIWSQNVMPGKYSIQEQKVSFSKAPLYLVNAASPNQLISNSVGIVFADETDKYPAKAGKESSPMKELHARMRTFPSTKKMFAVSTPTTTDGVIWSMFLKSDQSQWEVPCLNCNARQRWTWSCVKWEERERGKMERDEFASLIKSNPDMVWYECPHCHRKHYGGEKLAMNHGGIWVPTFPERRDRKGFQAPSMCSPFVSWHELAAMWQEAMHEKDCGSTDGLMHFSRHEMAQPFDEKSAKADFEALKDRIEGSVARGVVPEWVKYVTAGVDVQEDRMIWSVWGWGIGRRCHLIDFGVDIDWPGLEDSIIHRSFKHETDEAQHLKVQGIAIDSGFRTAEVYQWVYGWQSHRFAVFAIKGMNHDASKIINANKAALADVNGKNTGREIIRLDLNVNKLKDILWNLINAEKERGVSFCESVTSEFLREFMAEERVNQPYNGMARMVWRIRKGSGDNHAWDTAVYALAVMESLGGATQALLGEKKRVEEVQTGVSRPSSAPAGKPIQRIRRSSGGLFG